MIFEDLDYAELFWEGRKRNWDSSESLLWQMCEWSNQSDSRAKVPFREPCRW